MNQTGVDRLQKLTKEYGERLIEHVDWLDRLTFPRIEQFKKEVFSVFDFVEIYSVVTPTLRLCTGI